MPLKKTQDEIKTIVNKLFEDYIEKKRTRTLYKTGLNTPKRLLIFYYLLNEENRHLNVNSETFLKHYIASESILEYAHLNYEKEGLKAMYEYLLSDEIGKNFDIYTILDLHIKLFSKAPYPENAGHFRNDNVYLPNTGINLSDWRDIWQEVKSLEPNVEEIKNLGKIVKENRAYIFTYIDKCIKLKCDLIKIHPFFDGNGRTIRAFINKLFMDVDLPPIYISSQENMTYRRTMQKAIGEENDYLSITKFYYYKICDMIIELERKYKNNAYISSMQTVITLVKNIKDNINEAHYSLDEEIAETVKDYLDEKDISAQIFNIRFFEPTLNPHAFVMASCQDGDNIRQVLIDPIFTYLVENIKVNPNNKFAPFLENLKENGASIIDYKSLTQYILLFNNLEKTKQKIPK